jgi:hypothetical protein
MAPDKNQLHLDGKLQSITKLLGAHNHSPVYRAFLYPHQGATVIELEYLDASKGFIKIDGDGVVELGGTEEMGTGTQVAA